jgi:hypothetical protein
MQERARAIVQQDKWGSSCAGMPSVDLRVGFTRQDQLVDLAMAHLGCGEAPSVGGTKRHGTQNARRGSQKILDPAKSTPGNGLA